MYAKPRLYCRLSLHQKPLSASTRCMLYTARIQWIDENRILIASGTAFGEVIIWSYTTSRPLSVANIQTHYFYAAHEGSVFGISIWFEESPEHSRSSRLLVASSSDDRTIRLWDVSLLLDFHPVSSAPSVSLDDTGDSRSTENAPLTDRPVALAEPHLLAKMWAHTSRVWLVDFVPPLKEPRNGTKSLHFLSTGEDATCRLWKCSIGTDEDCSTTGRISLSQVKKVSEHCGKNVWSMSHSLSQSDELTTVSGGADGQVQICKNTGRVPGSLEDSPPVHHGYSISDVKSHLVSYAEQTSIPVSHVEEKIKSYTFVCDDGLLIVTSCGRVLFGIVQAQSSNMPDSRLPSISWTQNSTCSDLGNNATTVGVPVAGIGFFTGVSGKIYSFHSRTQKSAEVLDVHSKPRTLLADYVNLPESNSSLVCLFVNESIGASRLLLMPESHFKEVQPTFKSLAIPTSKEDAVFSMKCHSDRKGCLRLLLGTRNGKVMMYAWSEEIEMPHSANGDLVLNGTCIWTAHKDTITSLFVYESTVCDAGEPCQYLLTTSRDGSYAIHKIETQNDVTAPMLMHRIHPPLGPNLEGAYFDKENEHLILYGYRGIDFVAYNETLRKDDFNVDAGGAHRAWAFKPRASSNGNSSMMFAWTRAGVLHFRAQRDHGLHALKSGGHGREIKACAIQPTQRMRDDCFNQVVATGAEDTHIRLFDLSIPNGVANCYGLDCIGVLRKHNTGVQQLQWSEDGDYLFSGGGCEELFVWRIRRMPLVKVGVVCEASLNPSNHVSDLRITGLDLRSLGPSGAGTKHLQRYKVLLCFSNSTLRVSKLRKAKLIHTG